MARPKVIDIHAHLLNAHYVPLAGVFRQYPIENEKLKRIVDCLRVSADAIEAWIQKITITDEFLTDVERPYTLEELKNEAIPKPTFRNRNTLLRKLKRAKLSSPDKSIVENINQDFVDIFQNEVLNEELKSIPDYDEYTSFVDSLATLVQMKDTETIASFTNKEEEITKQYKKIRPRLIYWLITIIQVIKPFSKSIRQVLDWVYLLTQSERGIDLRMQKLFSTNGENRLGKPKVDLYISHDMDMENWYQKDNSSPPKFLYANSDGSPGQQQIRMEKYTRFISNGRLISFIAYDPLRNDYNDNGPIGSRSLDIIKRGIEEGFYLGVKFYPPSGYRPFDNSLSVYKKNYSEDFFKDRTRGHYKHFDTVLYQLFEYCEKEGIPVFSHCNNGGMVAYDDAGWNTDPKFWELVLQKFNNLHLCLAHAGGPTYWSQQSEKEKLEQYYTNNYSLKDYQYMTLAHHNQFVSHEEEKRMISYAFGKKVHELCQTYPNVYCEMGHNEESLVGDVQNFVNRFSELIKEDQANNVSFNISEKMMYGSDFHLLYMEAHSEFFLNKFIKAFNKKALKPYREHFFNINASKYLNCSY